MTLPTLKLYVKSAYGSNYIYPDCPISLAFTKVKKTKTLLASDLQSIQEAGFSLSVKQESGEILTY